MTDPRFRDQLAECEYGHTKAHHDAVGACTRPSLDARKAAAVAYPDPTRTAVRIAFERGWDTATAEVDARVQAAAKGHGPRECVPVDDANRVLAEARAGVQAAANQRAADELEAEAAYDDAAPEEQYARGLFARRLRVRADNLRSAPALDAES